MKGISISMQFSLKYNTFISFGTLHICIHIPDEITASLKHRNPFTIITDGDAHQIDLDPMMLTILGIVAGVLIVIIIVTLAIRIHASRSRGRLRTRAASSSEVGNGSGNKVVVTTIEELDIDHNSSTASLMVVDHQGSDHSIRSGGLRSSASASTGLTVAVTGKNVAGGNPDLVSFIQQQPTNSKFITYIDTLGILFDLSNRFLGYCTSSTLLHCPKYTLEYLFENVTLILLL